MNRNRKRWAIAASVSVLALGLVGGWAFAKRPRELPPRTTVLPSFAEPDHALPRAPSTELFGARIGATELDGLREQLRARGLDCEDTGVRASIDKLRAHKREQLAAAEEPDAVTGASILRERSNKESNPQIRLSCELDSIARLDPSRPQVAGRGLFVWDSPAHPLRHASLRRTYRDVEAAMLDVRESVARFEAIYGEPTTLRGVIPLAGDAPAKLEPIRAQWRYADLLVEVTATRFGAMVSVDERVEVPWPIRADAPTL